MFNPSKKSGLYNKLPQRLCGIDCMILCLSVLIQYRHAMDEEMDEWTDRHTTAANAALA